MTCRMCVEFFCSTKQLSFFLYGREREKSIPVDCAYSYTWWLRRLVPLSGCISLQGNGQRLRASSRASNERSCPFPMTPSPSHQPLKISTIEREFTYSPDADIPQCSTKSICSTPGFERSRSVDVLTGTLLHNNGVRPEEYFFFMRSTSFSCFSFSSIVEATMACNF